ncbi:MAG: hypothetical protein HY960_10635 [Ignavibacteriae bacterium]|nr:hypothetical protein [Ignavibacteriota bacterium]
MKNSKIYIFILYLLMVVIIVPPLSQRVYGQTREEMVPDLQSLLKFQGYAARTTELTGTRADSFRREILSHEKFKALQKELVDVKGYSFNWQVASVNEISLRKGSDSTTLQFISFVSKVKTQTNDRGRIAIVIDKRNPAQSMYLADIGNVYGFEPDEIPRGTGLSFNKEPWFTVQIGIIQPCLVGSPWKIHWYRYWWYDSHRHTNWWYGYYWYSWWWWQWNGCPWWWWNNWWWGYYYHWGWYGWSTQWPLVGQ